MGESDRKLELVPLKRSKAIETVPDIHTWTHPSISNIFQ